MTITATTMTTVPTATTVMGDDDDGERCGSGIGQRYALPPLYFFYIFSSLFLLYSDDDNDDEGEKGEESDDTPPPLIFFSPQIGEWHSTPLVRCVSFFFQFF